MENLQLALSFPGSREMVIPISRYTPACMQVHVHAHVCMHTAHMHGHTGTHVHTVHSADSQVHTCVPTSMCGACFSGGAHMCTHTPVHAGCILAHVQIQEGGQRTLAPVPPCRRSSLYPCALRGICGPLPPPHPHSTGWLRSPSSTLPAGGAPTTSSHSSSSLRLGSGGAGALATVAPPGDDDKVTILPLGWWLCGAQRLPMSTAPAAPSYPSRSQSQNTNTQDPGRQHSTAASLGSSCCPG